MSNLSDLPTPSFIVNRAIFVQNCVKVKKGAAKNGIRRIRPHVKTHKTMEGAYIQAFCRLPPKGDDHIHVHSSQDCSSCSGGENDDSSAAAQVIGFVASTVPELTMLAKASKKYCGARNNPFSDVIYAIPISEAKLDCIDRAMQPFLSETDMNISVLIDHPAQVEMIEKFVRRNASTSNICKWSSGNSGGISAFLKLDTGYHRAGISCDKRGIDLAMKILASGAIALKGLYTHCGHAYDTSDPKVLDDIAKTDLSLLLRFEKELKDRAAAASALHEYLDVLSSLNISIGSTPSLFHHSNADENLNDRLEIHPGNYTFYDRQQIWSGAAKDVTCLAGRVLTRVIGHYEDRNSIMLDAGALALTKDTSPQGGVCEISGRPDLECYKMSQEVTLVRPKDVSSKKARFFDDFPLGSIVTLLPNHSCLSAACFDKYHVIDNSSGEFEETSIVIDEWLPAKGW